MALMASKNDCYALTCRLEDWVDYTSLKSAQKPALNSQRKQDRDEWDDRHRMRCEVAKRKHGNCAPLLPYPACFSWGEITCGSVLVYTFFVFLVTSGVVCLAVERKKIRPINKSSLWLPLVVKLHSEVILTKHDRRCRTGRRQWR